MADYKSKKFIPYDEPVYERIRWLNDMFHRYEDYYRPEIQRLVDNQRMYWGVNFGQWPAYAVEKLRAQGRRPPTFNILAKKIESQIGSYLANGFDLKYQTIDGKNSYWVNNIKHMQESDKYNLDWETSEIIALRDMHVMVGYERMYVSDMYDADFGNIAFEPLRGTRVYIDPSWQSPWARDIDNYFEWNDMLIGKIAEIFPKAAPKLAELKDREEREGVNYGEYAGGVQRYRTTDEKWGDYHKVITFHHVVKEERYWEYDLVNNCAFPETGFERGSKEDREAKQQYMIQAGIGESQYTVVRQIRKVKKIEAFAPTVSNELFLASGKDRIQTNNCNIYPIGNQLYGQFRGVVDDLHDVQVSFNKGKMNIEDIQTRSAKGAMVLDEALAGGDARKKAEIESRWGDPAARIWVDEGSTAELGPHGGVIELKGHAPTPDLFQENERTLGLADWLSSMPAAMDSRTESTTESGKLYQSKVQVGLIGQKYGMKIWERQKREKYQAYILQAKITYSGYPRSFSKGDKSDSLTINERRTDSSGRIYIANNIVTMPQMKAVLVPSASGLNIRSELRTQYAEALPLLNDPADRLIKLIFIGGIIDTQEVVDEESKQEIKRALEVLKRDAMLTTLLRMKQTELQLGQMGMQPQGQGGAGDTGGGQQDQITDGEFDEVGARDGTPQDIMSQTEGVEQV